jgi:nucleoside-diphosphate-sugar epimerase
LTGEDKLKKILIVGGCGYIGGFLTDYLVLNGYNPTVYDNLLYENRFLKECDFIYGDIRNFEKLNKIIHDYDIVVWLAAIVGDGACAVNPSRTKEINTTTVEWLVDNYGGKIIFPSTCSVYGINDNLISEDAAPKPLSLYAETKLTAERYILKNTSNTLVFRLGTLFGLGDRHSRMRLDLVANILSMKAASSMPLTVFGGTQWRPLLHVRDVSTAIVHGIENNLTGLYNLSYKNYTILELAKKIKAQNPNSQIIQTDMKFEDLRNYRVTNDKIVSTGWKPKYSLDYGIKQISELIKNKRIKDISDPVYSNAAFTKVLNGI